MTTVTGLERLVSEKSAQKILKGNVAYLAHSASIDKNYLLGVYHLQKILGKRLVKIFGPQHGFVTDVQDNMIESSDFIHPFFKIPVHSLYGESRIPTDQMLEGVDTFVIDLQDVGTRVYTYISTLGLCMEACGKKDIKVVVLDRPNPVGGEIIEGPVLLKKWQSFVGHHQIPQRHSLTMGEMAILTKKYYSDCELDVVKMQNWKRSDFFINTGLPWVNPSPNLPTMDGAITFVGTVLFEGTNLSEGRGTTRSLEVIGHPKIEPFSFVQKIEKKMKEEGGEGFILRPLVFMPAFQKFANTSCGGVQIHVTDAAKFKSWKVGQLLCREFSRELGADFKWRDTPYEYEHDRLAIDLINGTEEVKKWADNKGSVSELQKIESAGLDIFLGQRQDVLIYR